MKKKIKPKPQKIVWEGPEELVPAENPMTSEAGKDLWEAMDKLGKFLDDNPDVKPKTANSLKDINAGTWIWANQIMSQDKKAVRKASWPSGDFMWWRNTYAKMVYPDKGEAGLIWPISRQFLNSKKLTKFLISSHYDKWEDAASKIRVGWQPTGEDKAAIDWEVYEI